MTELAPLLTIQERAMSHFSAANEARALCANVVGFREMEEMGMGWFHNAKLKRRADEAFYEGDEIRFDMGDLKSVPIEELHHRIARLLRDYFSIKTECSIEDDQFVMGRIYVAAAEYAARLHYSGVTRHRVQIMFLTADRTGPKHMDVMLVYGTPTPSAPQDGKS